MHRCFLNHIAPSPDAPWGARGRRGTVVAHTDRLEALLGTPHSVVDGEKCWEYATPRGYATIHTYWWNHRGEYSIGAARDREGRKAALWLAGYMRAPGFSATTKSLGADTWTQNKLYQVNTTILRAARSQNTR